MDDNRSKKFIFVPFCLLAQAYQAQGIVKYEWKSSVRPIVDMILDNDINIIQMPCPETEASGLVREPKGITKYDTKEFNEVCEAAACRIYNDVKRVIESGYDVVAILGIEQSPSCCVNYIYSNKGMENRKGLFIEKVYEKVKEFNIPIIGVNRKYVSKSLKILEEILNEDKNGY